MSYRPDPTFEETVLTLQARYDNGSKEALARMILHCAATKHPLPEWAAAAFLAGYLGVARAEIQSWDDVLGRAYQKGRHRNQVAKESRALEVYHRCRRIHETEKERSKDGKRLKAVPIDRRLFERVGRETGIGGASTIARLYSEGEEEFKSTLG